MGNVGKKSELKTIVFTSRFFDGKVLTFHLCGIEDDRGVLIPIEFQRLPFLPVRAFLVQAPSGTSRGGHGHRTGRQIFIRVSGEIEIELCWQNEEKCVVLGPNNNAILIAAPVWSRLIYHGESPSLMALCDTPYDPSSYLYEKG